MNKLFFTLLLAFAALTSMAQTSIPNGNFEAWTPRSFEHPKYYTSSAGDIFRYNSYFQGIPLNCEKTTDAYHGTYAVKMFTAAVANRDTTPGYIVCGEPGDDPNTWHGGIPISEKPTGIRGYYKGTIATNDTALIIVTFSKAGTNIGAYIYKIASSSSAYTLFSYTFSPALAQTPDSMIFGAVSTNPFNDIAVAGSTLYVDSISLVGVSAQPAMLNGDFEQWETETIETPTSWYLNQSRDMTNVKSSDAYKGAASIKLITREGERNGLSTANGSWVSTGYYPPNCNPCDQMGGYPFSRMTDTVVFWYKYAPTAGGKAHVRLHVKKNGGQVFDNGAELPAVSIFTKIELPIFASVTPDTLILEFESSRWEDSTTNHIGSTLIVDEVQLKSAPLHTGIFGKQFHTNLNVYPNPAREVLHVVLADNNQANGAQLRLLNSIGQTVLTQSLSGLSTSINTSSLSKGVYLFVIENDEAILKTGKVVIE